MNSRIAKPIPLGCPSGPVFERGVSMASRFWPRDQTELRSARRDAGVARGALAEAVRDGRAQRHARQLLRRRPVRRPGRRRSRTARRSPRRARRSSTSAASRRGRARRRSRPRRSSRASSRCSRGSRGLPSRSTPRRRRSRERALELGAELVNDVTALRGDPALAEVVAERGRVRLSHAHAGRAADDAGRSAVRRRGGGCVGLPRRAPRVRRRARDRARTGSASTPASASARRPTRTSSCSAASTSSPRSAARARRRVARRARSARCWATRRRRPEALAASRRRAVAAFERGASMFRVHDVRETVEALAVAAAVERGRITRMTIELQRTCRVRAPRLPRGGAAARAALPRRSLGRRRGAAAESDRSRTPSTTGALPRSCARSSRGGAAAPRGPRRRGRGRHRRAASRPSSAPACACGSPTSCSTRPSTTRP